VGRLCIVVWYDAAAHQGESLEDCVAGKGFATQITKGDIIYIGKININKIDKKEGLVIRYSEVLGDRNDRDFVVIPLDWVSKIEILKTEIEEEIWINKKEATNVRPVPQKPVIDTKME